MSLESLHKVFESRGEGIAVYVSQEIGASLGGSSAKRLGVKIPKNKPRGFEIDYSILAVGVEIPFTLALPLRWRLELDHVAISRELKPQFRSQLEERYYCRSLFDVKPLLSQGRRLEAPHVFLKASFDAAHPIVLRDASLFSVYKKTDSRLSYAASYYSGSLVIEPGSRLTLRAPSSSLTAPTTASSYIALLLPSPLSRVSVSSSVTSMTVEGPGFRVVELPVSPESDAVTVEYHQQEVKFYPRKAVLADSLFVYNKLDAPQLRVKIEKQELVGDTLGLELAVENPDDRSVEEVAVAVRHGVMNIKEIRLPRIDGKSSTTISIPLDLSKITIKPQRLVVKVEWVYEGVPVSSFTEVKL